MRMRALVGLVVWISCSLVGCTAHRRAGTGDVAFRLVWAGQSDLDLLVEDPAGECIFFGNRESAAGGLLDVDCNAASDRLCQRPVENVYWAEATAPAGRYRFWVHAHALIPAEAPLPYRLQLLRGSRVIWVYEGELRRHQEAHGPFVYRFPGDGVAQPPAQGEGSPPCKGRESGILTSG